MVNGKRKPNTAMPVAVKRRRRIPNGSTVQAYIDYHDGVVSRRVFSFLEPKRELYRIPEEVFQNQTRGVMDRALYRSDHKLPIGALNPNNVRVVDNAVLLPEVGSGPEDYDYGGRTKGFVTGTFGETGDWEDRDHFLSLLGTAGLNRAQYNALYFHRFVLNREQRADRLAEIVERMRHRRVRYKNMMASFQSAYADWEKSNYKEVIDLKAACKKDDWAFKVYNFGVYLNEPDDRLRLIRNIMRHVNDYRVQDNKPIYTQYQIGALTDELFPGLSNKLFKFMWEQELDLDFKKSRNYFKS
ncbi:hypothetical protein ABKV19_001936 [Rosa sericea]